MSELSHEEIKSVLRKYIAALEAKQDDEALKIIQQLPLPPHLGMALKHAIGPEAVKQSGFDFTEVEARYGNNWLTQ